MGFMIPKPKMMNVAPAPVPTPPTIDDAAAASEQAAKDLRMRRGSASTVLTSSQGDTSTPTTATKTLLGS